MEALGLDIGGVITDRNHQGDDFWSPPATPGVFDAIQLLVSKKFGPRTYLISKCSKPSEVKILAWLDAHDTWSRTGLLREHVFFCRGRKHKAPIATRLGITHFVDDRLEVLSHFTGVPFQYLYRPSDREVANYAHHLPRVQPTQTDWLTLAQIILGHQA